MDAPDQPHVEIFAPFNEAFELTKKILFAPFDLKKWFVIGFAAWLATFFSGGGGNYRSWNSEKWNWKSHEGLPSMHDVPPWVIPLMIGGGFFVLVLVVVLLWVNSRGRFMFTDCIVRNRGAIADPWREYRSEGNRYFVFQLVVALCAMIVFGLIALIFVMGEHSGFSVLPLTFLILVGVTCLLIAILVQLVMRFMVPVMYRQRCDAMSALHQVWALVTANPGIFLLFFLFYVVIAIAGAMIGCLAACVTCCVAAIPYVGTVILLPVVTCLFAYPLCFLRQFGDPYDVWAVLPSVEPPPAGPPAPPVQEPPPTV